jgi:fructose-bisphosphate aldolase, class II
MTLVRTQELLDAAVNARVGVAAFNVITLEHAEAIAAGAQAAAAPAILQVSQNAVKFHGGAVRPLAAALQEIARAASVDLALHLDHVEDIRLLHQAADSGFSSVMFDASMLDYAANIAATDEAARWAHQRGLLLEAELGYIGGKAGSTLSAHAPGVRTDPTEATEYVAHTGVDALAVAVGSTHAMTSRSAVLDNDLIARLRGTVPVPLVLHGSSGVADEDLAQAVTCGITKVNIGTILNVAFTNAVRDALGDPTAVDPRKYLSHGRDAIADVVHHLMMIVAHPVDHGKKPPA